MIDAGLMDLIKTVLNVSTADVNAAREALLDEQRTADARYAASSALVHPEGSTTPINEAYSRAQGRVADLRTKALKELPAAFKLLLALDVAMVRRDEAKAHRDMKWDQQFAKDTLGVDPAVADWFARLHKHGVHPSYLKQQAGEMVAIIADLVTWKAKDPKFRDPNNPWRSVLQIYATRRIAKPIKAKAKPSSPGTPTRDRHIADLGDYMFNEMVSAAWEPTRLEPTLVSSSSEAGSSGIIDCSTYPKTGEEWDPREQDSQAGVPVRASTDDPEVEVETEMRSLTPERAQAIAEAIYSNPRKLSIYWPSTGIDAGDYEPGRLIPALEQWVASPGAWTGAKEFLAAAQQGRAREFIDGRRTAGARYFAERLMQGDERAIAEAQAAGLHD